MQHRRGEILGQINRLRNDKLADNQEELQWLKSEYNQVINEGNYDISAPERDIFDTFPPEIWTQIIRDALPSRGCSSALLLLTMVSQKWQQQLTSSCTLWGCIELRGSQEDSLATIETFFLLSGDVPVHLYIYVPTYHDDAFMCSVLTSIGPRLRETTIRLETGATFSKQEYLSIFQLLLTNIQQLSNVVCINLEVGAPNPIYDSATARMLSSIQLPSSLRAIRGWHFLWRDFLPSGTFLNFVDEIDSYTPMNHVISTEAPLPKLKSLRIHGDMSSGSKYETLSKHERFPRLGNLTTLAYNSVYRESLVEFLLMVAPQLSHLELTFPWTEIPLLHTILPAATMLRNLSLLVDDSDIDGQSSRRITLLDLPPVSTGVPCLRDLAMNFLSREEPSAPRDDAVRERIGQNLCTLIGAFSILYRGVEVLKFIADGRYPESHKAAIEYVAQLPMLRKLVWPATNGYIPYTDPFINQFKERELKELEYLDAGRIFNLGYLNLPKLLSLKVPWGGQGPMESHATLRKLFFTCEPIGILAMRFAENSYPSLQELTICIENVGYPSGFGPLNFESFQFQNLSSITIMSVMHAPHETMLCFALLYEPDKCRALNEIKFRGWPPDWDSLFLMLEKRNFMANSAISKIRRVTLPFIPWELRSPLALLLGGKYAERPCNEDLLMGGAKELLVDENVPGCLLCLVCMRSGCTVPVVGATPYPRLSTIWHPLRARFKWSPDHPYSEPALLEWIKQRKAALRLAVSNFTTWADKYEREAHCNRERVEMEITEYGVILGLASGANEM